jgi:2-oxo-4-hydroxy-4-carboxy-5-ureidoimidazoline decarboxylase
MNLTLANHMDVESFVAAFGAVFEKSPWVARVAWAARPFDNITALHRAMVAAVEQADPTQQLTLLCAHPELAGREAAAGELTAASQSEQAGAGLTCLSAAEMTQIRELNRAYRKKFRHPFIIAVGKQTRQSIFAAFKRRLANSATEERAAALSEVFIIARLRLDVMFT